jgi:ATP-dependent DNA helicase RecG
MNESILHQPEGKTLEFKRDLTSPRNFLKTLVAFYDDRIEVESPGILLPGMTVVEMKRGISQIRNPVIARVFKELNLIEQWGSGVPDIFREASKLGLPEPEIIEICMRVRFIVHLKEPTVLVSRGSVTPTPQVTPQVKKMVQIMEGEMSREEIQQALGLKDRKSFRTSYLLPAMDAGLIEMTMPDKPSSRSQKYRLTADGKAGLDLRQ